MRKWFLLGLGLLSFTRAWCHADTVVVRNKWCTRTDTIELYKDGWNLLQVYGGDVVPGGVKFRSYDGDLKIGTADVKKDTLAALAMPFESGKKFKIGVVEKRSGRLVKEIWCVSRPLPEPVAVVGFLQGNSVAKKDLLAQSLLRVTYPGSSYCYPYKILSYSFKAYRNPVSVTKQVEGAFISLDVQKVIKDLAPGTAIVFSDIIAVCPECNSRKLKDIKLVVK
ncbi:MAG: hypothetical protein JSS82_07480 [Bacteroidetes bacterium]|nr:hypothetical protein [Bacteroidota bacterium]